MKVLEDGCCYPASREGCELAGVIHSERAELLRVEVLDLMYVRESGALQVLEESLVWKAEVM